MRAFLTLIPLAMLGLATAGCAVPAPGVDTAPIESKLNRLDGEQQELSQRLERLQDNLTLLEARLQDQQRLIEEMRQGEAAQKVTPAGEKAATLPPAGTLPPPAESAATASSPTETYLQAFADYASGRYDQAILGFETFIRQFPNNDYAANAQYWLGECYYSRQDYARAVTEFRKMVETYPQGTRAPDALLKIATALEQMNEPGQAERALQLLRSRYPDSPAAKKSLRAD